jgi:hypothetical protein
MSDCLQILSAETMPTEDTQELGAMLMAHLREVRRRVPTVSGATFVINVESNLAFVAVSLDEYVRTHRADFPPRVHVLRADLRRTRTQAFADGGITDVEPVYTSGSRTTARVKKEQVNALQTLLRGGLVYFAKQFADRTPGSDARGQILSELAAYQRILLFPKLRNGHMLNSVREMYSGKGRGATHQDDWASCLLIATFTVEKITRDTAYDGVIQR